MLIHRRLLLLTICLVSLTVDSADRTIYQCVIAGVRTFSDRPCGDSIEVHSLEVPTPGRVAAELPPAVLIEPPHPRVRKTQLDAADRKNPQKATCERLDTELRQLAARMRAGYKASAGERLRDRQRAAQERRRELHCR